MTDVGGDYLRRVAPLWAQPLRWGAAIAAASYYHLGYRIRGWGSLPRRRGPTLLVANHQHDVESAAIVASLSLRSLAWRYPIFTVSSRRMWEPGFMAERIPWLAFALRRANVGWLFSAIGLQPIENDLHARPFASIAFTLLQAGRDHPLDETFRPEALARLPGNASRLSDLLAPAFFHAGRSLATLSELREPYRSRMLQLTRESINADLDHFERLQKAGATIFSTPEGSYSGDGRMRRLRGVLSRLAPWAQIWVIGISYDPFVGRRLSLLYRLLPASGDEPLDRQIKRARPVTVSAVLGTWLNGARGSFTEGEAEQAVTAALAQLPPGLFVDPDLRRRPRRMVRAALAGLQRLGVLARVPGTRPCYALTSHRTHPQFPRTADIVAYQANFHRETLEGASAG
jgi:hypothetical protein